MWRWLNIPVLLCMLSQSLYAQVASSNLPLLLINTNGAVIRDDPRITASLKVIDNGPNLRNKVTDEATGYNGYISIEIRGQSSQMFPKKGYGFETTDILGNEIDAEMPGMPAGSDWVLYAPYSDKSLLRNALTYYLGRKMGGEWQPRFIFCELYINGYYNGIYMLVEKIKRAENRVDIARLRQDENSGDDLTGGYIVKVDKINGLSETQYFLTYPSEPSVSPGNNEFTYVYPDWDVISPEQKSYIQNYIQTVEWSLRNASSSDPENGFRRYLDEASFVDFQIMQELTNNVDGYKYSTFFYKKKDSDGGRLFAGPLWDFDLCYGNVDYSPERLSTAGWLYTNTGVNGDHRIHWWSTMMNDRNYRKRLVTRWQVLRAGAFHTDSIMSYIENTASYLSEAAQRNFARWPVIGNYVWPNAFIGSTWRQELDYLKNWTNERLQWIDSNIEEAGVLPDDPYYASFNIYPNPSRGKVSIEFYSGSEERILVELFDLTGRKINSKLFDPAPGGNQYITYDFPKKVSGYYIIRISQGGILAGRQKIFVINN